jgi:hypothetical protein
MIHLYVMAVAVDEDGHEAPVRMRVDVDSIHTENGEVHAHVALEWGADVVFRPPHGFVAVKPIKEKCR